MRRLADMFVDDSDAVLMTAAEARAEQMDGPIDGRYGCPDCGRSRAECRGSDCGGCLCCETCGVELPDPVTYIRCHSCRGVAA